MDIVFPARKEERTQFKGERESIESESAEREHLIKPWHPVSISTLVDIIIIMWQQQFNQESLAIH